MPWPSVPHPYRLGRMDLPTTTQTACLKAKVDTGAKTSSLHAFRVDKIDVNGQTKVRFGIHPIPERTDIEVYCVADLVAEREVTSSSGQTELRYVIRTMAQLWGSVNGPLKLP